MIAIIDYGMGNLRSVSKAFEAIGARVEVTNDPSAIRAAKAVVLPGVGAFARGMKNLNQLRLTHLLNQTIEEGRPFLGICLGLQLLFTESQEHGSHKGLDVIKGKVRRFGPGVKIPQMGWNTVKKVTSHTLTGTSKSQVTSKNLKTSVGNAELFWDVPDNSYFYFVHSYFVEPEDKRVVIATTKYGEEFTSAIRKKNVFGVQFHPEKSSDLGLKVLANFLKLSKGNQQSEKENSKS